MGGSSLKELTGFYKKRWIGIFPSFYITFLLLYIPQCIRNRSLFYLGHGPHIITSILGLDGFLLYRGLGTYYQVGEWFLGAILLLYLLYPVINFFFRKNKALTMICAAALSFVPLISSLWVIDPFRNLLSCMVSFIFGMWFIALWEERAPTRRKSLIIALICLAAFLAVIVIPIADPNAYFSEHIAGMLAFIAIFILGGLVISADRKYYKAVKWLSSVIFEIFLVHHVIVIRIITPEMSDPGHLGRWLIRLGIIALSVLIGTAIHYLAEVVKKRRSA